MEDITQQIEVGSGKKVSVEWFRCESAQVAADRISSSANKKVKNKGEHQGEYTSEDHAESTVDKGMRGQIKREIRTRNRADEINISAQKSELESGEISDKMRGSTGLRLCL